jgi:excinuclease ABC subunit B
MAKSPDKPKKPKDPAKPTRSKASREPLAPIAPALEKLLNPGISRGTAGVGSQTGLTEPAKSNLQQPPDNSFDRRADFSAAHKARLSTPQGFSEAPQKGYVAREPFSSFPSPERGGSANAEGVSRGGVQKLRDIPPPVSSLRSEPPSPAGGGGIRRDSRTSGFGPLVRPLLSERTALGPLDPDVAKQWGIEEEDSGVSVPSPLVGEGQGGGSVFEAPNLRRGITPTPDPSPQGGGEPKRPSGRQK